MGLCSAPVRKFPAKVNRAVEAQTAIIINVDVQRLKVSRGVDKANIAGLHKVIRDDEVLLVWRDLDIVRTNSGLVFIWVVKTLDVVEVGDVESSDMVSSCEGQVEETAVLGDVGVDRHGVAGFGTEVVEELSDAGLPVLVLTLRVDNPDLA